MTERVLITGASGFIGYYLVKAARDAGFEVHAAVRRSSNVGRLKELGPVFVYPDFGSEDSLSRLMHEGAYSYVIHAAGATRAKGEEDYNLINAKYTLDLARAAQQAKTVRRFVFLSSLAAKGPVAYDKEQIISEATKPAPVTAYGRSKLLAEEYLQELEGLPVTIIRPTAVYGPGEKDIFILFKTLSRGLDAYIGKDPQRLSFVYVKDLAGITIKAMLQKNSQSTSYNISDGQGYEKYALADQFNKLFKRKTWRVHIPVPMFNVLVNTLGIYYRFSKATPVLNKEKLNELTAPNWMCSIDKAKEELNYHPAYNLENGLAETLQWYKKEKWL